MVIEYFVDHRHKVVIVKARGAITIEDILTHGRKLDARHDVCGYAGLVDMSRITDIVQPSGDQVRELASVFARCDGFSPMAPRLAVFVQSDVLFGLARMFESHCSAEERCADRVGVFRSLADASKFLGLSADVFADILADA